MGRLEDARKMFDRLTEITPFPIPDAEHWRVPEQREFYLEGLHRAAGEAKRARHAADQALGVQLVRGPGDAPIQL